MIKGVYSFDIFNERDQFDMHPGYDEMKLNYIFKDLENKNHSIFFLIFSEKEINFKKKVSKKKRKKIDERVWIQKNLSVFRSKRETHKSVKLNRIEKSLRNLVKMKKKMKVKNKSKPNLGLKNIFQKNSIFATEMDVLSKSICKKNLKPNIFS